MRLTNEQFYTEVLHRGQKQSRARRRRTATLLAVPAALLIGFLFGFLLRTARSPSAIKVPETETPTASAPAENATGAVENGDNRPPGSSPAEDAPNAPQESRDNFSGRIAASDEPFFVTVNGKNLPDEAAAEVYAILAAAVLRTATDRSAQASLSPPPDDAVSFDLTVGENTARWTVYPYALFCADADVRSEITSGTYRTLIDLLN